jgi:glycine cleavage system H protein
MTQFFKWVSGILHPLLLPFFGILLLFQVGTLAMYPTTYKLYILILILLNTGLLPGLIILYLSKKGIVSDLDVSDRKQRVLPYIIIFVLYLLMVLLLTKTSLPWFVVKLYMGSLLSIVVSFIITLKWKISAHTMAYGCLVGGSFIVCLNQRINPVRVGCGQCLSNLFFNSLNINNMTFPEELLYTKDHEWIKVEGDEALIGITDFAQSELGDIIFTEFPSLGETLDKEAVFGTVEAVKAVSEVFMPIKGEVIAVNDALTETPEVVNKDPYGAGWMIRIRIADPKELAGLMNAETYSGLMS